MFRDRMDAGQQLAQKLRVYRGRDAVVLAVPRGGVPVAAPVAEALGVGLDIVLAHKISMPPYPELALGAVSEDGGLIWNTELIRSLGLSRRVLQEQAEEQLVSLRERAQILRGRAPRQAVEGRTVIIVDDGLATGSTMEAAILAVRRHHPTAIVAASPVGPVDTLQRLHKLADAVVCIEQPWNFRAVGEYYQDFDQVSDHEVQAWLNRYTASV